jgi:hypothetical protein
MIGELGMGIERGILLDQRIGTFVKSAVWVIAQEA